MTHREPIAIIDRRPTRHGEIECDPEPGDLIWRLTEEAIGLIQKVRLDPKRPEVV